jgi:signal transduction histidine kinase
MVGDGSGIAGHAMLPMARNYVGSALAVGVLLLAAIFADVLSAPDVPTGLRSPAVFVALAITSMAALASIIVFAYRKTSRNDGGDATADPLADTWAGTLAPFQQGDCELAGALRRAQFAHIVDQLSLMMLASAANAIIVAVSLWGAVSSVKLGLWLATALVAFGLGLVARLRIAERMPHAAVSKRTLRRTTLHAGLRGLIWGMLFALFFAEVDTGGRLVLVAVAAGMLTAGVPALAPVPSAALLYSLGIIVPTILRLLSVSGFDYLAVALFGLTFSGSMVVVACQLYGNFAGSLISRRIEAEQSATISLLLREFEANASDWLFETDGDGRLVRFPERMAAALGLSCAVGAPEIALSFAGAGESGRRALLDAMDRRAAFRGIEVAIRHPDGRERWMALTASPKSGGGYRGVGSDITELKQREAVIAEKSRRFTASNEELQQFATVASHDLQEPLRKIEAFGKRLAARNAGKLDDESTMYVERMLAATKRMRTLITDLLAYSRVARASEGTARVDLDALLATVVDDLSVAIEDKGARIEIGGLGSVPGKATLLRQLFQNLHANALKFSSPGASPEIRVTRHDSGNGQAQFHVADNGIGFRAEDKAKIFEIFQRLHGREQYEGTGVGLATCRRIAEAHGGTIDAESAPGKGATFIVALPAAVAAGTPASPAAREREWAA